MEKTIVDTRGRACPEPVLMTKKALEQGSGPLEILLVNKTALGNVTRFLKNAGVSPVLSEQGDEYTLSVSR